jgi:hypothetical protein
MSITGIDAAKHARGGRGGGQTEELTSARLKTIHVVPRVDHSVSLDTE